jgi:putative tryptophan/tyrosine transport system ATP-binding protein
MITHNLDHALTVGSRTIMMHEGRVILDLKGAERSHMSINGLLELFEKASGIHMNNDRMMLTGAM